MEKIYLQIRVAVNAETSEAVSDFLFGLGASGIMEDNSDLVAYFQDTAHQDHILASLSDYLTSLQEIHGLHIPTRFSIEYMEDRDWNAEWKRSLQPLTVSENILIKPTWVETPKPAPPIIIEIDPEMAFGSGEHATTRMTLQLVEKCIQPKMRVLDVGTGTGILAIGALKLGAAFVFGCDVDPIATETAQRNAEKNGVADRFVSYAGSIDAVQHDNFDMITANVNRTQILAMLPRMRELLGSDGILLISGILDIEEQIIRKACAEEKLIVIEVRREQEWLAFETRKR